MTARVYDRDVRWLDAYHYDGYHAEGQHDTGTTGDSDLTRSAVPPFGVVVLQRSYRPIGRSGKMVWDVRKPGIHEERGQDPGVLAINGPTPIPIGGYGRVTCDWPAQALVDLSTIADSSEEWLTDTAPFYHLGPRHDSWQLHFGGAAFAGFGPSFWKNTRASGLVPGNPDEPIKFWVRPSRDADVFPMYAIRWAGQIDAYQPLAVGAGTSPSDNAELVSGFTAIEWMPNIAGIHCLLGGLYNFGFQATLSSDAAPSGSVLGMQLHVADLDTSGFNNRLDVTEEDITSEAATSWIGYRLQDIELADVVTPYDSPPTEILRTAENVAVSGGIVLEAGQVLRIKSYSPYEMDVGHLQFWVQRSSAAPAAS